MSEPVGVVGVGWVGLVTAACFASQGHEVWAMDVDEAKVAKLSAGEVTFHEPGLAELVTEHAGRLHFTTDMDELLANARLLFCCVDTPPTYSGDADLSRVRAVVDRLPDDAEHALVMKSTVPSGTGAAIRRDLPGLSYVSCPEFLKEGSAVEDFLNPDRVVVGADDGDDWAADAVAGLYEPLGGEIVRTDVASAEMIKLASNAFLATKISFINEIANVCEEVGADVTEVARGMGLDERIGGAFLKAGIGYGGSCLLGEETVLIRRGKDIGLTRLDDLFGRVALETDAALDAEVVWPDGLQVLARSEDGSMIWSSIYAVTSRPFDGEVVEVRTKMGRRLTTTADHPFAVVDPDDQQSAAELTLAGDLTEECWLPLASGPAAIDPGPARFSSTTAGVAAGLSADQLIFRPAPDVASTLGSLPIEDRRRAFAEHPRGVAQRSGDVKRSGALRLNEALELRIPLEGGTVGTARNGTYVPIGFELDEDFWRVLGLYLAEGHCSIDGRHHRHRLCWSFHPTEEEHLVDFVASYWRDRGVKASVADGSTARIVSVSSKLIARWFLDHLRTGVDAYSKRIPDIAWSRPAVERQALLGGLWAGDGSWSRVNRGNSVVLEYGTVSAELADGMMRMLQLDGIVASRRVGRVAKSTVDTHWLRVSGADQVERASFLVDPSERDEIQESLGRLQRRIRSTGYRRGPRGSSAVRVTGITRRRFTGRVFSLEIPAPHQFVATGGLVTHNCFPKDVSALKQLAGNSGYHFQLLNSVIEVNELQKRRVIGKLTKHLGSLVGKRIALLGLAFKPNTDDMREASSLVLSARLQGEGAEVVAYDPVATDAASGLLTSTEFAASAAEALSGADGAILVTEWAEFADLDWRELAGTMRNPVLIDGRNFLDPEVLRAAGFAYEGIGR
ncbi:MAG: nucleotide sugar dehydrogenase [Solirubrobacterales bacterium]